MKIQILHFTFRESDMELPNDIQSTLEQICQNEEFLSNISYYTKVAFDCILTPNRADQSQTECPTPFLLAITYCVSNGYPLENLSVYIPESAREQYTKAIKVLEKKLLPEENITMRLLNDHVGHLRDVKWQMSIENGRDVWIVELNVDNREDPVVLKLNYEQLSLFSFKINQLVGHIKSLDLQKVI